MDPDSNYREQELIYLRIKAGTAQPGDHGRLKALVAALRGWVTNGGFKPTGYVGPAWRPVKEKMPSSYTPSLCNHPHSLKTGRPIRHQCRTIPPATLRKWREQGL